MATVVCFISEKGGVGKTTACYHIGIGLNFFHEKSVLFVDADYQRGGITGRLDATLLRHLGSGSMPGVTLFHKYQQLYSAAELTDDIDIKTKKEGIDFIPADPRLSTITTNKLPATNNIRENNRLLYEHLRLIRRVLTPHLKRYDYVLIDTHPEVSDVLRSVIYASEFAVSPVKLDLQSSVGVPTIINEINTVNDDVKMLHATLDGKRRAHKPTQFAGSIGMMAREYGGGLKYSESAEYTRLARLGPIFDNYVTEGDGLRQAALQRTAVYFVSGANADKQAGQFREVTREFIRRCP